jgi:hypothetical protein
MNVFNKFALITVVLVGMAVRAQAQQVIGAGTYNENFNSIGSGLPAGWTLSTTATATSLGTQGANFITAPTSWADTIGAFKNFASATGLPGTATRAQQRRSRDRAFGFRQNGKFGDPGAAFTFSFSTSGIQVTSISIDLMMLGVQTRSTSFSIQYGVGANSSSFTTLGTWADPGAFGTTNFNFTSTDFGSNLDNQPDLYFRVVTLAASTGVPGSRDAVGIDNFSITAAPVPEPSVYMLLGVGILLCGQRFLRRRNSA